MRKKFLSVVLVSALLCTMMTATVFASEVDLTEGTEEGGIVTLDASGECGTSVSWTYEEATGTLTISGSGEMEDYSYDGAPWYEYAADITTVVIESGVTSIGAYAFYECTSLSSVTLPDGLLSIGKEAFAYCRSLTDITFPDGLLSIGGWAFEYCNLTSVTIPASVTDIESYAFHNSGFSEYIVDSGNLVYSSEDGVLFNKDKTQLIECPDGKAGDYVIPSTVTEICEDAFVDCTYLTSVVIPDSVVSIGNYAFSFCVQLTSIVIPDSVTSLGKGAFFQCQSLTDVTLGSGITSIEVSTFEDCWEMSSITIPVSVTSIADRAFYFDNDFGDVYYGGTEEQWASIEIGYDNDWLESATIHYTAQKSGSSEGSDDLNTTVTLVDQSALTLNNLDEVEEVEPAKTADANAPIMYGLLIAMAGAAIVTLGARRRVVRR